MSLDVREHGSKMQTLPLCSWPVTRRCKLEVKRQGNLTCLRVSTLILLDRQAGEDANA